MGCDKTASDPKNNCASTDTVRLPKTEKTQSIAFQSDALGKKNPEHRFLKRCSGLSLFSQVFLVLAI
jgi:hypothetical protein